MYLDPPERVGLKTRCGQMHWLIEAGLKSLVQYFSCFLMAQAASQHAYTLILLRSYFFMYVSYFRPLSFHSFVLGFCCTLFALYVAALFLFLVTHFKFFLVFLFFFKFSFVFWKLASCSPPLPACLHMSAFGSSPCLNHNITTDFSITEAAFSGFRAHSNVTNKQLSWYI